MNPSIEEYNDLRKQITFLEDSIGKFYTSSLTVSVVLLSGLGAFLLKSDESVSQLSSISAYFFLAPPLINISFLYLIASHRKSIHRIASYLKVFYEQTRYDIGWESRLDKFRQVDKKCESLDAIPISFWVVYFLCVGLYGFTLDKAGLLGLRHLPIPLIEMALLLCGHRHYSRAMSIREHYCNRWNKIKRETKNQEKAQ